MNNKNKDKNYIKNTNNDNNNNFIKERVQKFISISGFASRRKAEDLIRNGRVKVNGKIINLGDKCFPNDLIEIDNKKINFNLNEKIYIVLNKKVGYTSSKSDEFNRKTIYNLLKPSDNKSNLFSVGRLDRNTSGLIILTNDGGLSQRIIHPSKKIPKEYVIGLNKKLKNEDRLKIENGLILDGFQLSKCNIYPLGSNYRIIIYEGRKRQIRRIFEMVGYEVISLKRTRIGNLNLNLLNLKEGEYKLVKKEFLEKNIFINL